MIEVTMTREVYKEIVYLACATATNLDTPKLRQLNEVLDILEAKGEPIAGQPAGYTLRREEDTFEFENAEAKFVLERIEEYIPNMQGWAARKALSVIDQLKADPKKKPAANGTGEGTQEAATNGTGEGDKE